MNTTIKVLVAGIVSLLTASANAMTVEIEASDTGWLSRDGHGIHFHDPSNSDYLTGQDGNGTIYRSFFNFDLTSLAGYTVNSATLELYSGSRSDDANIKFFEVETPYLELDDANVTAGEFNDLRDGKSYHFSYLPNNPVQNSIISFELTQVAIDDLNSKAGQIDFSIGGNYATPDGYAFLNANSTHPQTLVLNVSPVPEPSTFVLMAGGLGLIGFIAARRRKQFV